MGGVKSRLPVNAENVDNSRQSDPPRISTHHRSGEESDTQEKKRKRNEYFLAIYLVRYVG